MTVANCSVTVPTNLLACVCPTLQLPVEDDIDLSDFDMDGEDTKDEL